MDKRINPQKPVFKVKQKHAWRDKFIRSVELGLVFLVVIGTIVWLLLSSNFSFDKLFGDISTVLKPKIASESATKNLSNEEKIKKFLSEKHLVEVASISKTKEEDFEIKSKNGQTIVFSKEKSIEEQVSTLQTLLAKAKIEGKSLKKADFRFSKIVVEY